jgi:hypothetical protein
MPRTALAGNGRREQDRIRGGFQQVEQHPASGLGQVLGHLQTYGEVEAPGEGHGTREVDV